MSSGSHSLLNGSVSLHLLEDHLQVALIFLGHIVGFGVDNRSCDYGLMALATGSHYVQCTLVSVRQLDEL